MNWLNPLFLIPIITSPAFVLIGFLMLKYPPREINNLYGYRTSNSMKSQERWDFAQKSAAREFMKWGTILALTAFVGLLIEVNEILGVVMALAELIIATVIPIRKTERALKQNFNKV